MKKTRIEGVENATVRVSNAADTGRRTVMTACVTYGAGGLQNISTGEVTEESKGMPTASFDQYGADNLNIRWNLKSETLSRADILHDIEGFIEELSAENPLESLINTKNA